MRLVRSRTDRIGEKDEPGAVVVGGDYQGLGIARSLGRKGVQVVVLDDELSISRASRYVTRFVRVPDLLEPDHALPALMELGASLPRGWVLFPTREETVALIARHRDLLSRWYRVPVPSFEVVRTAWDKRETYQRAAALGIPTPATWLPRSADDLDRIPLDSPVVLKPAIKEHFFYRTKAKAWRADTLAELHDIYHEALRIVPAEEVIIQELVPGDGCSQLAYCALVREGSTVAAMGAVRLRQHPSDFGRASTYVQSADLPELEELAARLLGAIRYDGLVEVEFKRDERDGRPKLLDVNARTWGYVSLGGAAGVDFPHLLFSEQLGRRTSPCQARPDVRWVRLETDLPNAARDIGRGKLRIAEYLKTLGSVDTEAVFATDDPLPGLLEVALTPYLAVKKGL